jgi:hypothetical protein
MGGTQTLEVPEALALGVRAVAARTGQRMAEVLADWLSRAATELPNEHLSDNAVLALRDLQLDATQQAALDDLLTRQREGHLTEREHETLDELLDLYRRGMLYKARALKVAVARGLQPPLGRGS